MLRTFRAAPASSSRIPDCANQLVAGVTPNLSCTTLKSTTFRMTLGSAPSELSPPKLHCFAPAFYDTTSPVFSFIQQHHSVTAQVRFPFSDGRLAPLC